MKILLIFTLYLISGGVVSIDDVIGFPGGTVLITCRHIYYGSRNKFICKQKTEAECENIAVIEYEQHNTWIQKDRTDLFADFSQTLLVAIRQLSSEDAGLYKCGEERSWSHSFNLRVINDSCCLGPKTVTGYLGENVTISCSYPEQYERHTKTFYRLDAHRIPKAIDTTDSQIYRFSISDNRTSKVVSVRIRDVREEDGGGYYCAVIGRRGSFSYSSLYTEIQLQVTGSSVTIIVSVCVALLLLLISGLTLMFYRHIKAKGSASSSTSRGTGSNSEFISTQVSAAVWIYEEIKDIEPHLHTETALYDTIQLSTILALPPNTVYVTAQLPTMPSGCVSTGNATFSPSDSLTGLFASTLVTHSAPPSTVHATTQLPPIPSDPTNTGYPTAQLPTIPSDPTNTGYPTAQLPTIPSDPTNTGYPTTQLPPIPSDPTNTGYPTAQSPPIPSDPTITGYPTAQSPPIPSDPTNTGYPTAQSPPIPSDPTNTGYPTAQSPPIPSDPTITGYPTAQSPPIPSDPTNTGYPTAQSPPIPSDPTITGYPTAQLPPIPSDPTITGYPTAQSPPIPSDPTITGYPTAQLPPIPSDPTITGYPTAQSPPIPSDPTNTGYPTA